MNTATVFMSCTFSTLGLGLSTDSINFIHDQDDVIIACMCTVMCPCACLASSGKCRGLTSLGCVSVSSGEGNSSELRTGLLLTWLRPRSKNGVKCLALIPES